MNLMAILVTLAIVGTALGTVAAMMYAVSREKHEHEEWFIPPEETPVMQPAGTSGAAAPNE